MDEQQKYYCRPAEEFTIKELEDAIEIQEEDEYEVGLFNYVKISIDTMTPRHFIDIMRGLCLDIGGRLFSGKKFYREILECCRRIPFSIGGFGNLGIWQVIVEDDYSDRCGHKLATSSKKLAKKIIEAVFDLGYVRNDLRVIDERIQFIYPEFCARFKECLDEEGFYETYNLDADRRIQNALKYLESILTPLQYGVYAYNIQSETLIDAVDNVLNVELDKMTPSQFLPYSEFEYMLLYAAQRNVRCLFGDELFNIFIS